MNTNDIAEKAKAMNIDIHRMRKGDMIRAIQRAEDRICCYGTEWVDYCAEELCMWRGDCYSELGMNKKK